MKGVFRTKKRIIVFLSLLCMVLAGLGCFAVSATDIAVVNSGYNNSAHTNNTTVMSHSNYASIISRNNAHNNRYKEITAQVYLVNSITEYCYDEDFSCGNDYHYDATVNTANTNNFLAVGAMGNTQSEQAGIEEWVVILTKKTSNDVSLPYDYYGDYLS